MFNWPELQPCKPHPLLSHAHAQTILGSFMPSQGPEEQGLPTDVDLGDGDRITVVVHEGSRPLMVHIWHGLGGHAESGYVKRASHWLLQRGYYVLRGNHRGCGVGIDKARQPYHSGRSDDLASVLKFARNKWPSMAHIVIGFSLSGNALLLLLGKGGTCFPDAAISVNAPINLGLCARELEQGINRLYDIRFARLCKKSVRGREQAGLTDHITHFPLRMTLRDFDNIYTAPAGGFRDREDYYETCSAGPWLSEIKIPTFMMTAEDDPMVPIHSYRQAEPAACVHFHLERFGGHMGYLSGVKTPLGTKRWLDYAITAAVDEAAKQLGC